MRRRTIRRIAALLSLAAILCAHRAAVAAEPEASDSTAKSASRDSSRFLPRWLHLHAAVGLGWLASPEWMRKFYQAGQGYEIGLETRPGTYFRLRLNGEYQVLPAVTDASYGFITSVSGIDGSPRRDTVLVETRATGWIGSGRLEGQIGLTPHLWLIGGIGRGYLETGLKTVHAGDPFSSFDLVFPGASGWVWMTTGGASYEFDLFGPRLSAELRSSYLMRERDRMQTWSLRLGWGGY
jgi:hypothetical protein